jgi:hypothetical protein
MKNIQRTFAELVRWHFKYLTDEYGFSVKEKLYGSEPFSDGIIEFQSSATVVVVQLDRFDLMISIGPSAESEAARLGLSRVIEFLTQGTQTFRLNFPAPPISSENSVESGLAQYAPALRQYCDAALRGDLSWWPDACKYAVKAMQDEYRSLTGLELPQAAYQSYTRYIQSEAH